jgi:phosphoserine phosphatase
MSSANLPPSIAVMFVATLISNPAAQALDTAVLRDAASALHQPQPARWLSSDVAADIVFDGTGKDARSWADQIRVMLADRPIDVVVQPLTARRKRLLIADMDSTMIGQECIDELADYAGLKSHVAAITERAMRGEIAFEPALRERVNLLAGLPVSIIETVIAERIRLTPGGAELVGTMRAHGAYTALVSGGFTLFTEVIARRLGFDENQANQLIAEGNVLAGTVAEPILGREAKRQRLIALRNELGISLLDTLAVGDGANDLAMLEEAGLGVAFRAKPAVAEAADARIEHSDLTALLFAQGYGVDSFVRQKAPD